MRTRIDTQLQRHHTVTTTYILKMMRGRRDRSLRVFRAVPCETVAGDSRGVRRTGGRPVVGHHHVFSFMTLIFVRGHPRQGMVTSHHTLLFLPDRNLGTTVTVVMHNKIRTCRSDDLCWVTAFDNAVRRQQTLNHRNIGLHMHRGAGRGLTTVLICHRHRHGIHGATRSGLVRNQDSDRLRMLGGGHKISISRPAIIKVVLAFIGHHSRDVCCPDIVADRLFRQGHLGTVVNSQVQRHHGVASHRVRQGVRRFMGAGRVGDPVNPRVTVTCRLHVRSCAGSFHRQGQFVYAVTTFLSLEAVPIDVCARLRNWKGFVIIPHILISTTAHLVFFTK